MVPLGAPFGGGHHSTTFDVGEKVIQNGAESFAAMHDTVSQDMGELQLETLG